MPDKKNLKGEEGLNLPYSSQRPTIYRRGEGMRLQSHCIHKEQRGTRTEMYNPHLDSFLPQIYLFRFSFADLQNSKCHQLSTKHFNTETYMGC